MAARLEVELHQASRVGVHCRALMAVDKDWGWGPTNNYCKWFHVCEHESNHNGQIKFFRKRIPGSKADSE